jgi:hypothetical protein
MTDVKYFRDLAAECRRLAKLSYEPEMSAELNEIADALTASADELDQTIPAKAPAA